MDADSTQATKEMTPLKLLVELERWWFSTPRLLAVIPRIYPLPGKPHRGLEEEAFSFG